MVIFLNSAFKKRIDELGRIVIPKQIRDDFNINNYDELDIFMDNGNIVIKKNIGISQFKEKFDKFLNFINNKCNFKIIIADRNNIISSNHNQILSYIELKEIDYNSVKVFKDKFILKLNIIIDSNYIGDIFFLNNSIFEKDNNEVKEIKDIILNFIK